MDKYIGQVLNQRYVINEIIGVGGMAVVYKAYDRVAGRVVAVKILKDEFMSDAQFRRRFTNESKAITMLAHKNIVDIFDVCLDGDVMFIAMEYIDGITLKEYIEYKKVLSWDEAASYVKQILSATQHAHERGIVHRDLKPQNIMLLRDGTIKVMDFGIARLSKFDTQTITDKAIGSVHYISPEQASGDLTDEKSDIYSIGVMMYEMITGQLPFVADSAVSVALMQVQDQPVMPRDINEKIPQGIEQITLKAMMKNPDQRYPSVLVMLEDIETVEENPFVVFSYDDDDYIDDDFEDVEEEEESIVEVKPKEKKKNEKPTWLPIVLGGATALLLFITTLLFFVFWDDWFGGEDLTVPNLVDMNISDVLSSDEYKDFKITQVKERASEKQAGTILEQTPDALTTVKKGQEIKVTVSSGIQTVSVPDILGKTKEEARKILNDNGIQVEFKEVYNDDVEEGLVIRTNISAGEEIDINDTLTVYISLGSETKYAVVPNLEGKTKAEAKSALESVKLLLGSVSEEYHDTVEEGKVISQSVSSGSELEENSRVNVVISKGKEPVEEPPIDNTPEDAEKMNVKVRFVFDETYVGKTIPIKVYGTSAVVHSVEVSIDTLTDRTYVWETTAVEGTQFDIFVDGDKKETITANGATTTIEMVGSTPVTPTPTPPTSSTTESTTSAAQSTN